MPPSALSSSPPSASHFPTTPAPIPGVQSAHASLTDTTFTGYSHITWWVSNAAAIAHYYCSLYAFVPLASRTLSTGAGTSSRTVALHAITNGGVTFLICSPLRGPEVEDVTEEERRELREMHDHIATHGDAVRDVAFAVDDCRAVYAKAVEGGAVSVSEPRDIGEGVWSATVRTYGDTTHTLLQRPSSYRGAFLPGFAPATPSSSPSAVLAAKRRAAAPPVQFLAVDHCVGNQPAAGLEPACAYYERALGFHRFWSADDSQICTAHSALRSVVMASPNEVVKMPINEPAPGLRKSQVEEYVQFYGGAGVQHIALRTEDICATVRALGERGVEFISIPESYYDVLRERLAGSRTVVEEDWEELKRLGVLVDFDEGGYLLQLFTKPLMDRPTVFIEVIQRRGFGGFGAGNFRSLFEAIEREQEARGNL
ncbi:4-hydroxyphenylpyruvate dioxygenase [Geopyxis carbonaria]|nr:4-hydroxyphenylpyruvate dioxygenase [Geopyxis carbonaria]